MLDIGRKGAEGRKREVDDICIDEGTHRGTGRLKRVARGTGLPKKNLWSREWKGSTSAQKTAKKR